MKLHRAKYVDQKETKGLHGFETPSDPNSQLINISNETNIWQMEKLKISYEMFFQYKRLIELENLPEGVPKVMNYP